VIYTTAFADVVYVLCAFKKTSTSGIARPKQHIDVIQRRLKDAAEIHAERTAS
jgi:phage-related protein